MFAMIAKLKSKWTERSAVALIVILGMSFAIGMSYYRSAWDFERTPVTIGYEVEDIFEIKEAVTEFLDCWLLEREIDITEGCFFDHLDVLSPFLFLMFDEAAGLYASDENISYDLNVEKLAELLNLELPSSRSLFEVMGFTTEEETEEVSPVVSIINPESIEDDKFAIVFYSSFEMRNLEDRLEISFLENEKIACVYAVIEGAGLRESAIELYFVERPGGWFLYDWRASSL